MRRIGFVALALLAAAGPGLAAAGCLRGGDDKPTMIPPVSTPATSQSSASPTGTVTPSGSPTATAIEFTVDGAGPYVLGAKLDSLKATAGLDEITAGGGACPENTTARGTGTWKDIRLSFHKDGTLYLATNTSPSIPTPSGAWLGTPLAQLKTIYSQVNGQLLRHGTGSAYLVTTLSGRAILFSLDATMKVSSMTAGDATYLRASFTGGTGFC